MRYPSYEAYQDSGVEWLGKIPETWSLKRLKYLCTVQTGSKDTVNAVDDGEYPFFVRSQTIERINSFTADCEAVLTAGDGVGVGKVFHYYVGKFDYHQRVYMLNKFNGVLGRFVFYYLKNNFYKVALEGNAKSTVDSLRLPLFLNFEFSVPSISEQNGIVDFLDRETAKIDTLIAKQEALIRLLQEKRTAVISHAVTKGLNPHAPLKDSGIEWLGQIPAHWQASKPKYFTNRIVDGVHHTPNYVDEGIPFVTVKNLTATRRGISFQDTKFITQETHEKLLLRASPEQGDILITKDGTLGVTRVIDTDREFSIFVSVALIKPIANKIDSYFLRYVLESEVAVDQFEARKQGSGLKHLHLGEIANISITLPPLQEQKTIVDYIEKKIEELDELFNKVEEAIELLKERRIALISAAVTGKIDVRHTISQGTPS